MEHRVVNASAELSDDTTDRIKANLFGLVAELAVPILEQHYSDLYIDAFIVQETHRDDLVNRVHFLGVCESGTWFGPSRSHAGARAGSTGSVFRFTVRHHRDGWWVIHYSEVSQ